MNNNTNNSRIPKLRFPGFTGEWDYMNGNELFEPISNKDHNSDLPILALTQDQGAVPRDMINYNVIVSDKSVAGYKVVEVDDFIISLRSFQGGIEYSRYKGLCSPAYIVLRKKSKELCSDFYRIYFKSFNYIQELNKNLEGIRDGKMISYSQFSEIKLPKPSLEEQKKIASFLSEIDDQIASQGQKVDALKEKKKGLMQQLFPQPGMTTPRLRFPGFDGDWEEKKLGEVCNPITPPLKLQSRDYLPAGRYPVIDQSQSLICGWTNDDAGLITNVPVIIFGDHTCVLKYIDFPFVQGADGVKILSPKNGCDPQFVYQAFASNPVKQDGYKRHFSDFKEKIYHFPHTLPEQQKIASCLSTLDDTITAESDKLEVLKNHKKGLMQQLFPQPIK